MLFDKSDAVADSKTIFEEERAANAFHLALHHDADSVAKHVCLVHIMSRKNNYAILFVGLKHVPEVTARAQVHP